MDGFRATLDRGCQRGLHWRYVVGALQVDGFAELLSEAFPGLIVDDECWGSRRIVRGILPYRFEVRLGTRPRHLSLIHRMSASLDVREQDRERFDTALRRHVAGQQHRFEMRS